MRDISPWLFPDVQFQKSISVYLLVHKRAQTCFLQSSRAIIHLWKLKKNATQGKWLIMALESGISYCTHNLLRSSGQESSSEGTSPLVLDCSVNKASSPTGPLTGLQIGVSSPIKAVALWQPHSLAHSCRRSRTLQQDKKLPSLLSFSSVDFLSTVVSIASSSLIPTLALSIPSI